jgi:hypothetical protein
MIGKSLFIALFLFLIYELYLRESNLNTDNSQNDKSANIISVQNFLFEYSDKEISQDTIIVGSSVSRKIITDSLGKNFINLAFNAWSTYDGLELIIRSGRVPSCVLVETNYVKNQVLEPEITDNLEPISYYSGKTFKSLQLNNQPVGLLIGWGKNLMRTRIEKMKEEKRNNAKLYQLNLQMNSEIMNQMIPDSILAKRFSVLKNLISGLKKQNVAVIFYEVPFDQSLENAASVVEIRNYFHEYFPSSEFTYIPGSSGGQYTYSDGVHLSPRSALEYTLYLQKQLYQLRTRK